MNNFTIGHRDSAITFYLLFIFLQYYFLFFYISTIFFNTTILRKQLTIFPEEIINKGFRKIEDCGKVRAKEERMARFSKRSIALSTRELFRFAGLDGGRNEPACA